RNVPPNWAPGRCGADCSEGCVAPTAVEKSRYKQTQRAIRSAPPPTGCNIVFLLYISTVGSVIGADMDPMSAPITDPDPDPVSTAHRSAPTPAKSPHTAPAAPSTDPSAS